MKHAKKHSKLTPQPFFEAINGGLTKAFYYPSKRTPISACMLHEQSHSANPRQPSSAADCWSPPFTHLPPPARSQLLLSTIPLCHWGSSATSLCLGAAQAVRSSPAAPWHHRRARHQRSTCLLAWEARGATADMWNQHNHTFWQEQSCKMT